MKEKATMRRIWWFDINHMQEAGQWLSDLAAEGWQLKQIGLRFAKFERKKPADLRYLCVRNPYFNASYTAQKSMIEAYRESGWQFIDNRENFLVFCAPDGTALPPGADVDVKPGKGKSGWILISILLLVIILPVLAIVVFQFSGWEFVEEILLRHNGMMLVFGLGALYLIIVFLVQLILRRRLKIRKQQDDAMKRFSYRKMIRLNRMNTISALILYILLTFSPTLGYSKEYNARSLPDSLIILRISDITAVVDQPLVSPDNNESYYLTHGVLYPDQLPSYRSYDPSDSGVMMDYQTYHALSPWLADALAYCIIRSEPLDTNSGISDTSDKNGISRLWRYDGDQRHVIVAVKDSTVYYMDLTGSYTTEDILRALLRKIA